jgi:hypothetical protein
VASSVICNREGTRWQSKAIHKRNSPSQNAFHFILEASYTVHWIRRRAQKAIPSPRFKAGWKFVRTPPHRRRGLPVLNPRRMYLPVLCYRKRSVFIPVPLEKRKAKTSMCPLWEVGPERLPQTFHERFSSESGPTAEHDVVPLLYNRWEEP